MNTEKIKSSELNISEKIAMEKELRDTLWYCNKLANEVGLQLEYEIKGAKKNSKEPCTLKKITS